MTTVAPDSIADNLQQPRSENQWSLVFNRFRRHRVAMFCMGILIILFIASLLAPYITPFDRDAIVLGSNYLPPMTVNETSGKLHVLGTDHLGRDYFTRIIYAARVSLTVSITVVTISSLIGITLGLLAGYFGSWVDLIISRTLEFISTFPLFVILLVLMGILLQSEQLIPIPDMLIKATAFITAIPDNEAKKVTLFILVLALINWITTARLMRGMVLSVREQQYIEATRALGASNFRILLKHVFPNAFPPIIVDFTLQLNQVLILEAALSFLGFGIQDPTPTWGNMLAFAQSYMFEHPWMPLVPGLPILLTSLAINYMGDGLRDALDPRMKL
jgi:peptide/nickel transport system permease protein